MCLVFIMSVSFSYFDPSAGTVVLSSLWPLAVATVSGIVALLIKRFWTPLKNRIFGNKKSDKSG